MSNCTTALHLALLAVGVGAGDEVITVSHSFIATANAIRYCGATPVFVDIEPGTLNMDPALIEPAITARTKAILCVHQLGMPCDLAAHRRDRPAPRHPGDRRRRLRQRQRDSVERPWEKIGKPHGDIACFSFHPRKVITTGDGGMITTANPEFDRKFRLWRQHSMSVPDTVRHGAREVIFESYPEVGFNYRMTDMQAAVGRVQLTRLPAIVAERRRIAQRLRDAAGGDRRRLARRSSRRGRAPTGRATASSCRASCDQRAVMQRMLDAGVSTRRGVMNAHLERPYQSDGEPRPVCRSASARSSAA